MHCCKNFPIFSQIPVYATTPVISLGRTFAQDLYSSNPLAATFIPTTASPSDSSSALPAPADSVKSNILLPAPSSEEITQYFGRITPLKYSQPLQPNASYFSPPLEGLTLTAYGSGHTVGGTIWHIQHGMESIVYAVDWNQARENVIAGAAWFGGVGGSEVIEQLRKPTALICDSKGATQDSGPGGIQHRDKLLLDNVRSCLAKGGTVFIPCDSSGRVLELAYVLERAWENSSNDDVISRSRVYLASKTAAATMRHARSLLEWMDDSIVREFEGGNNAGTTVHRRTGSKQIDSQAGKSSRPFELRHIKLLERKTQVQRILKGDGPRVILASNMSLDWGFSTLVLESVAQRPENLVVLTQLPPHQPEGPPAANLLRTFWQWYMDRSDGVALETNVEGEHLEQVHTGGRVLAIPDVQRSLLDAKELSIYQQYLATQRQLQSSLQSRNEVGVDEVAEAGADDSSSSSSEDSDEEHQGRTLNVTAALGHASRNKAGLSDKDLGINILLRKKNVYDFDVRNKKGRNAVFPFVQSRRRGDEFGDFIKPEAFVRAEEKGLDVNEAASGPDNFVAQKRKWEGAGKGENNKRQQVRKAQPRPDEGPSDDEDAASEASDAEPETDSIHGPSKVIWSTSPINVQARLAFVDFTGIHDRRSLQMLIPLIQPRKLVLIGGSLDESKRLAADCKDLLAILEDSENGEKAADIFTPAAGETIDASVDTNAWLVTLSRDLVKRLNWQNVRNIGVVALTGHLKASQPVKEEDEVAPAKRKRAKLFKNEPEVRQKITEDSHPEPVLDTSSPLLDVVPPSMAAATRSIAQPLHVGDMRLADLRKMMQSGGHTAEFRGEGTLVINGLIAIRKLGTGKIVVEGAPVDFISGGQTTSGRNGGIFYQVKRKIYESLAVVAGG